MTDDIVEHFGQKFGQIHKVFLNPNTYYTAGGSYFAITDPRPESEYSPSQNATPIPHNKFEERRREHGN